MLSGMIIRIIGATADKIDIIDELDCIQLSNNLYYSPNIYLHQQTRETMTMYLVVI